MDWANDNLRIIFLLLPNYIGNIHTNLRCKHVKFKNQSSLTLRTHHRRNKILNVFLNKAYPKKCVVPIKTLCCGTCCIIKTGKVNTFIASTKYCFITDAQLSLNTGSCRVRAVRRCYCGGYVMSKKISLDLQENIFLKY